MTDFDFDEADIREMRRDGSFREFMRHQIAAGRDRRPEKPAKSEPPRVPGHRPGAWPPGISPPERPPDDTTFADWLPALADIREYLRRNPPTD